MKIPKSALAPAILAMLALGLAACNPRHSEAKRTAAADPSAVVIGVTPAPPSGDPPGTTPVSPDGIFEVSKSVEQAAMPLPGQPNDHSNVAATPSQRAETSEVNQKATSSEAANSGGKAPERAENGQPNPSPESKAANTNQSSQAQ